MSSDADLLRRYASEDSEVAFAELVRRHLGLVYGCALRRVGGDVQLAEDVAQTVFADLARKAGTLAGHATVSGWLYVSTLHASAAAVRSERRRKLREEKAALLQTAAAENDPAPEWEHLRPVLDELVLELKCEDREAVALRFFEQRTFADIGVALRLTEEAARKRVDRALEKLQAALARRGITSSSAAVGAALAGAGMAALPAGLAVKVTQTALAPVAGVGAGSGLGAFLGSGVGAAGLVAVLGALAVADQYRVNRRLESELAALTGEVRPLSALRAETLTLARAVAEADELRRMRSVSPAPPSAPSTTRSRPPARPANTVAVRSDGTLLWGQEPVNLAEFVRRLKAAGEAAGGALEIRGDSGFPQLAYVIDEARKSGIAHIVVHSATAVDANVGQAWFGQR